MAGPTLLRAPHVMRLAAAFMIAVTLAVPLIASQPVPRLMFGVVHRGFNFGMYVARPSGDWNPFVLFQGETVDLDIAIYNGMSVPQRVDTTGIPAAGAFRLIARDGGKQSAELAFSTTGHVRHARRVGDPRPVVWGSVFDLEPETSVTWRATLEGRGEPGTYRWKIELPPWRTSMPLSVNSNFVDYALRAVATFADRAELLRRKMVRAESTEDPSTERAALDLLAFYPESHEAHVTLGRLYRHAGRKRDSRRHYDAAIRLLKDKRDRLYLEHFERTMHYTDPIPILRAERDDKD